ncbi:MAG: flippase [Candidatus Pacebacteria bacterium]|nr:flippase [Candidatus Paceibacterota bacterium]
MHNSILKNISWQTLYQFLASGLGLLFNIILARTISQFEFGTFNYIISILSISTLFLELGIPTYFWRKWSTDISKINQDISSYLVGRVGIAIPISFFLFFYVFFIDRFVSLEFLLAYIYFLLDIFVQPTRLFFSSQNKYHKTFIIDGLERCISLGLGILLLILHYPLRKVFLGFIFGRLTSILLCYVLNKNVRSLSFSFKGIRNIIHLSIPLFMIGIFSTLYFRIDTLMIRYLLGMQDVAIYMAAYRLLDGGALIPGILTTATMPLIVKLYHDKEKKKLTLLFHNMMIVLAIPALYIASVCLLFAPNIIPLIFGPEFNSSIQILRVLGLSSVLLFLTYPLTHFMVANKQETYYVKVLVLLTVTNIVFNILLIPKIGILGSALATLLCELLSLIFLYHKVQIKIPIKIFLKLFFSIFIATLITLMLPFPWYINIFCLGILYCCILLIVKIVTIQEVFLYLRGILVND